MYLKRGIVLIKKSYSLIYSLLILVITSKNTNLLQLVEGLQENLLHEQPSHRYSAVNALASILEKLSPSLNGISEKEIELMTEFFCSKLKDHHSLLPAALLGLKALVE